jgi:hypothetical protein
MVSQAEKDQFAAILHSGNQPLQARVQQVSELLNQQINSPAKKGQQILPQLHFQKSQRLPQLQAHQQALLRLQPHHLLLVHQQRQVQLQAQVGLLLQRLQPQPHLAQTHLVHYEAKNK